MKKFVLIYLPFFSLMMFSSFTLRAEWEPVNNGIEKNSVSIHFIKQYGNTLYAVATTIYADPYGVYKSNDYGESWEYIGLSNDYVKDIIKFDNNLFVCTTYNGIFFSSDEGKNWEIRNSGLIDRIKNPDKKYIPVYRIAKIGDTLFCADLSLKYSTNLGKNWNEINVGANRTVERVYEINNQLFLYIWQYIPNYDKYVLHSSDRGASWARTNLNIDLSRNNEFVLLQNKLLLRIVQIHYIFRRITAFPGTEN